MQIGVSMGHELGSPHKHSNSVVLHLLRSKAIIIKQEEPRLLFQCKAPR